VSNRKLVHEFSWFVFGQGVAIISALLLIRLLTEYMSVAKYGEVMLILSVLALFNQLIYGGISLGAGRFYSISQENQDQGSYFNATFSLFKIATFIFTALYIFFLGVLYFTSLNISIYSMIGGYFFSVFSGYNYLFNNIQSSARNRVMVAIHAGVDGLMKIVLALTGIYFFGSESYVVIASFAISTLIVIASQYFFMKRDYLIPLDDIRFEESPNVDIVKVYMQKIWQFSWPFSAWGIFTWAQISSDKWALQFLQSPDAVGFYAALFEIGYRPITLIIGLVVTFMTPILFQLGGDSTSGPDQELSNDRVTVATRWIIGICLSFTFASFGLTLKLHPWIFSLIAAEKFAQVSFYLPWMILAGGFFATGQALSLKMMSDLNTVKSLPVKIFSSLIGIALNFYGAWTYGLTGVVVANVIFAFIYFSMMLFTAKEILSMPQSDLS